MVMITDVYTPMSHGHVSWIAYLVEELLCIALTFKCASDCSCPEARAAVALQEVQLLKRISFDRNIVQFYGACLDTQPPMLVMEYMGLR